jgi:hypothetical protein
MQRQLSAAKQDVVHCLHTQHQAVVLIGNFILSVMVRGVDNNSSVTDGCY